MRPERRVEAHHFEALGTVCSLFGIGLPAGALSSGEQWVREVGGRLTRFAADSELSRLNASDGRWMTVSRELEAVLHEAMRAYESSGGLVNIAVLPSLMAIGYTRPLAIGATRVALESAEPSPVLPDVLEVQHGRARLRPGNGLDLGGIAKGWMADRLCEQLAGNLVANIGGDLRAVGPGPRGDGWPVGIGGATLTLHDKGAATSSVRKRRWDGGHHLIDPRTGLPSRSGLEEVSVIAETGVRAEVVAKTALLLGPEVAPAFCAANALAWWIAEP